MDNKQIMEWKSQYGAIHVLEIEGQACYYRGLSLSEHQVLVEMSDKMDNLDWDTLVIEQGLLFPEFNTLVFELTGSKSTLGSAILDQTLWDEEAFIKHATEARAWAKKSTDDSLLYTFAVAVSNLYPGLHLEYLMSLPPIKLMRLLAVAEIGAQVPIFDTLLGNVAPKSMGVDANKAKAMNVDPAVLKGASDELLRSMEEHKKNLR